MEVVSSPRSLLQVPQVQTERNRKPSPLDLICQAVNGFRICADVSIISRPRAVLSSDEPTMYTFRLGSHVSLQVPSKLPAAANSL